MPPMYHWSDVQTQQCRFPAAVSNTLCLPCRQEYPEPEQPKQPFSTSRRKSKPPGKLKRLFLPEEEPAELTFPSWRGSQVHKKQRDENNANWHQGHKGKAWRGAQLHASLLRLATASGCWAPTPLLSCRRNTVQSRLPWGCLGARCQPPHYPSAAS